MLKDLLEALLEAIDVIIDEMLLVDLRLVDKADQGQALVDLPEVKHNVFLVVGVCQSNDT